ncbi:MAG TPA: DUF1674 domain-containing protein [Chiayiivirga sp.]|nr:DUF1674 domain-containing protein [Chiayiivirga sp.]
MISHPDSAPEPAPSNETAEVQDLSVPPGMPPEWGGRGGLDPTRYGDWEKNGRCIDF